MTLSPEQFPVRIPTMLARWIPDFDFLAKGIKAATTARILSSDACWMLAEGEELDRLLRALDTHVVQNVLVNSSDAGERAAASDLNRQVRTIERYLLDGWREGRCVPWGIVPQYPSKPYRVHLARLVRHPVEPHLLIAQAPICNVQVKGASAVRYGCKVDCGTCKIFMVERADQYTIVDEAKEPVCPTM